jgi:ornithine cyclodeaminase/alanine dehydrogenase-like protein (mu-crystallin family)
MGFKAYSVGRPPHHQTPRAPAAISIYDTMSGSLLAIIAADEIGRLRTAAATAVSVKYMSRSDSHIIGLIGTGWQAVHQVLAVAEVRKVRKVRVFGRDSKRRVLVAEELAKRLSIDCEPVDSAEAAAREADILIAITSATDPVIRGEWLADGCHLVAAGGNYGDRREIDHVSVTRSAVVAIDARDQAQVECGDLISAASFGLFDWARAVELGAVVAGAVPGRTSSSDVTLFESQGVGILDVAAAKRVYDLALASGMPRGSGSLADHAAAR